MKKLFYSFILFSCFIFISLLELYSNPLKVEVKENRIYVNGKKFFVKGICYNPSYPKQGSGALTFKFLSKEIKETDFKMMKEAGFNTIRVYEDLFDEFYNYALEYDFKIIEPIIFPGFASNIDSEDALNEYKTNALKRVKKMKNHPTILMWSLWNDSPFDPNIVKKYGLKKINAFFKEVYNAVKDEDPNHLITGANIINVKTGCEMGFEFLDVIGCNTYLGFDHSKTAWKNVQFSNKDAKRSIKKLIDYSNKYNKPLIITETGVSTLHNYKKQGDFFEKQLKLISENLSGVCIFEWIDEWWKAGNIKVQDKSVEEHWGIVNGYRKTKPAYSVVKKYFSKTDSESNGLKKEMFLKNKLRSLPSR